MRSLSRYNKDISSNARKNRAVLAAGAGALCGAGLMKLVGNFHDGMQMARIYGCMAVAFILAFLLFKLLLLVPETSGCKSELGERVNDRLLLFVIILFAGAAVISSITMFATLGITTDIVYYLILPFICAVTAFLLLLGMKSKFTLPWKILLAIAVVFSYLVVFINSYVPDVSKMDLYFIHHYTAVEQSIFNVAFNEPFTAGSTGIYGHYAILMWPVLKLFGHKPIVINMIILACNLIAETAFIVVICKLTKNDLLRTAAVLGGVRMFVGSLYAAYRPLRFLFPMLVLLYIVCVTDSGWYKKHKIGCYILGFILCSVAITFQTDSGMVSTLVYMIGIILNNWQDEPLFSRKSWKVYGLTLLGGACSLAGMVVIVNIYNLLCGGPLVLKECFYPIIGGEGYVSSIATNINEDVVNWVMPVTALMGCTMAGMLSCRFLGISGTKRTALAVCGIMGLGQCYYFFNRASATWAIIIPYIILCAILLIDEMSVIRDKRGSFYRAVEYGTSLAGAVFLGALIITTLHGAPRFISNGLSQEALSTDSMEALCAQVEEYVPKDTYAVGYYVQDVYAYLGWDPGYHKRDVSDFFGTGVESVREEIMSQDTVLASISSNIMLTDASDLVVTRKIPEEDTFFYYMERYNTVGTVLENGEFAIEDSGSGPEAEFAVDIKANTMYKVDVTLSDDADISASDLKVEIYSGDKSFTERDAQKNTWLLLRDEVPTNVSQEEYEEIGRRVGHRKCFYILTGDLEGTSSDGTIRISTDKTDNTIAVDTLRVTELERAAG